MNLSICCTTERVLRSLRQAAVSEPRLLASARTISDSSTTTVADGIYGISRVASGSYRFWVILPTDAVFSTRHVDAGDLIDSDVDPATGRSEVFVYGADSASRSWDAGLRLPPFSPTASSRATPPVRLRYESVLGVVEGLRILEAGGERSADSLHDTKRRMAAVGVE